MGPPHLHFELRTPDHRPFNPLLTNLEVPDKRPPKFSELAVEPISKDARVEGGKEIFRRDAVWRNGRYDFGTINVTGSVGLGVDVFDQADAVANVYAVYELKLERGDQLLFHSRIDSFSYRETHQMFIDRVYPILRDTRRGFQRLFVADGNTLPFYKTAQNRGVLDLPAGKHSLTITALDFYGNRREATVVLNVEPLAVPVATRTEWHLPSYPAAAPRALPPYQQWIWHNNWLHLPDAQKVTSSSLLSAGKSEIRVAKEPNRGITIPLRGSRSQKISIDGMPPFWLHRIIPGQTTQITSYDQRITLTFDDEAVYDTLSLGLHHTLLSDSLIIDIYPHEQPLRETISAEIHLDTTLHAFQNPTIFWFNERKQSLYFQESQFDGSVMRAELESFGRHIIVEDTVAPSLSNPRIFKRADGKWMAAVSVRDARSGIDFRTARFYCNDVRGIPEYDPESESLLYYHPNFQPDNENELTISVADRAGNRTEQQFTAKR